MRDRVLEESDARHGEAPIDYVVAAAYRLLRATGHHALRTIVCELENETTLVLHGTVSTFYHKQLAQVALLNQPGIPSISNRIRVLGIQ